MDMVVIGGVVAGLVMGSFGYVLARFGIRPLLQYHRLKQGLAGLLETLLKTQAISSEARDSLQRTAVLALESIECVQPLFDSFQALIIGLYQIKV